MTPKTLRPFGIRDWGAAELADPYPIYQRYRDNDPVHHSDAWYVFRHDDVMSVLSNRDFGRRAVDATPIVPPGYDILRALVENWLVFLDPPRHSRLRSVLNREFSLQVVHRLRGRIRTIARDLVAVMRKKPVADLIGEFAAPLPILVISEMLGVPEHHRDWFRECALALQEASSARAGGRDGSGYARAENAARELDDYFRKAVRSRHGTDRQDLIALLVRARESGAALTDDEIVATCVHLLTAGHETTTSLLGKSVLALLAHPGLLRELRARPELLPATVEELIRYDSPVQLVTRWAYRDVVLRGRNIRRGDKVVLMLGSANRDPLRFPDPDVPRLNRDDGLDCGFGAGIHYCLGTALARAEAEIGLSVLFGELPAFSLADEAVRYADDLVFHGPQRLTIQLET